VNIVAGGFRIFVLTALLAVPSVALAQDSKSAVLAGELARLLDTLKLDSVAAQRGTDQYVGALYFPGSQLLVVGAKYSTPARIDYLLGKKAYRDVYADLSSASEQQSKIFVMDLGANGLRFKREENQPFDTADVGGRSVAFDGDWDRARISEAEYRKAFEATDDQYSQMLQALIAALKKTS
jgi:hypothetical protein